METGSLLNRSLLSEQVANLLTKSIVSGEYRIGEKLPTESSLCDELRVSRTVVREALKLLKQKGLVESRVAKGTFVISNYEKGIGESVDMMLQNLSAEGIDELLEFRCCIEPEFAALAAAKAGKEDLEKMKALLDIMESYLDDPDAFSESDMKFHMAILTATQNGMMISVMMPIFEKVHKQQYVHNRMKPDFIRKSHNEHKKIFSALTAGDPDAARLLLRNHILSVRNDFHTMKNREISGSNAENLIMP